MTFKKRFKNIIYHIVYIAAVTCALYSSESMAMLCNDKEQEMRGGRALVYEDFSPHPNAAGRSISRRVHILHLEKAPRMTEAEKHMLEMMQQILENQAAALARKIIDADEKENENLELVVSSRCMFEILNATKSDLRLHELKKRSTAHGFLPCLKELKLTIATPQYERDALQSPSMPSFITRFGQHLTSLSIFGSDNPHVGLLERSYPQLRTLTLPSCSHNLNTVSFWEHSFRNAPNVVTLFLDLERKDMEDVINTGDLSEVALHMLTNLEVECSTLAVGKFIRFSERVSTFAPNLRSFCVPTSASARELIELAPRMKKLFPELSTLLLRNDPEFTSEDQIAIRAAFKELGISLGDSLGREDTESNFNLRYQGPALL